MCWKRDGVIAVDCYGCARIMYGGAEDALQGIGEHFAV